MVLFRVVWDVWFFWWLEIFVRKVILNIRIVLFSFSRLMNGCIRNRIIRNNGVKGRLRYGSNDLF